MKSNPILDPSISHEDLFKKALTMDNKTRLQILRQLDLYRAIYNWTGKIERPNFEGGKLNEIVRAKYIPNSKHEAFFRAAEKAPGNGRWMLGGNRSGKTESGVREDVAFSIGIRPWFKRDDPDFRVKSFHGSAKGRVFSEDWEHAAKGVIIPKFYSVIPPELLISTKKNSQGAEALWKIKVPFDATGKVSTIELLVNKGDVKGVEGWDGDWIHFDEPIAENMYIAATRGLVDRGGHFWFTLTPLSEPWLFDDVVNNPDFVGFYVDMVENLYNPETGSGYLIEKNIDDYMKKIKDPAEREARLHGKFKHLGGAVFKEFEPTIHVYPNEFIKLDSIPETWWRDCLIDPGKRKPHCVVFVAWSPRGSMFVYDGFRIGDTRYAADFPDLIPATPTMIELISEIKKRCDPWPQRFFVDPLADTPDWDTGTSMLDMLSEEFPIEKWPKIEKEKQINPVQELMHIDEITGRPKLFINHMLTRCIYEVERYRWDEWATSSVKKYKPKVIKEDDDYVDCMMAAALNPPHEIDESLPEPKPHFVY